MPDARPPRRRRARGADHRDHRRPGADGRRTRARPSAPPPTPTRCCASCSAGSASRTSVRRTAFSFNVASRQRRRRGDASRGAAARPRRSGASRVYLGGMCPQLRGHGLGQRLRPHRALRRDEVARRRARSRCPATAWTAGTAGSSGAAASSTRTSRSRSSPRRSSTTLLYKEPTKIKVEGINLTYRGAHPQDPEVDALQGRRCDAAARPRVRRAGGHLHRPAPTATAPGSTPGARSSKIGGVRTSPTSARCRSATWPTGCASSTSRRSRRCSPRCRHLLDSFVEIGLGYLIARPAGRHAVRGRGAAHQDDPPPRLVAHRRHLRLRRADHRAAPPRHRADERSCCCQLRDKGNTVLVVEHKPETIAIADHVVDLGPGAGTGGGEVCSRARVEGLRASDTVTGRHLDDRARAQGRRCARRSGRSRSGAPTRTTCGTSTSTSRSACCACSPAWPGSGKSSLIHGSVAGRDGVVVSRPGRDPAVRGAATRRPTPGCSTRSARRSPRPTASSRRCSAPTPRAPARPATAPA